MTSDAQRRANAANAKRSTGPRTQIGRLRSSRNALKHGAWSSGLLPIETGEFSEDPAALLRYSEELIAGLRPRDELENQQALIIVGLYNRLRRVDQYEAH